MEQENAIKIAVLEAKFANLSDDITGLTAAVTELTKVMNRGRGAFAACLVIAGAFGAVLEGIMQIFHRA